MPEPPIATGESVADLGEDDLLEQVFPLLGEGAELLGPGDDTALLAAPDARVLVTTDAMVRGADWLDEWSSGADVGRKTVAQNVADIAAMGGVPTGLVVTLALEASTPVAWVLDLARGLAAGCRDAGTSVVGGDLSSAPAGTVMVCTTALGDLQGRPPVLRGGARVGDVVAVAGTLGRSGAGLALLQQGRPDADPALVAAHLRPRPPYEQGPVAAAAGAHAMIDLSDGLVRDAGRVARAGGVGIELSGRLLAGDVAALTGVLGGEEALDCVLAGGEEHSLLACFDPGSVPSAWRVIGRVVDGAGVHVDGASVRHTGWDHFGG